MKKIFAVVLAITLMLTVLPVISEDAADFMPGFWFVSEVVRDGVGYTSVAAPAFQGNEYVLYMDPSGEAAMQKLFEDAPRLGKWAPNEYGGIITLEGQEGVQAVAIGDNSFQYGADPENCLMFTREYYDVLAGRYYLLRETSVANGETTEYPEWETEPGQEKRILYEIFENGKGLRYDELKPEEEEYFQWEKLPTGFAYLLKFDDGEEVTITQTPDYIDFTCSDNEYTCLFRRLRD